MASRLRPRPSCSGVLRRQAAKLRKRRPRHWAPRQGPNLTMPSLPRHPRLSSSEPPRPSLKTPSLPRHPHLSSSEPPRPSPPPPPCPPRLPNLPRRTCLAVGGLPRALLPRRRLLRLRHLSSLGEGLRLTRSRPSEELPSPSVVRAVRCPRPQRSARAPQRLRRPPRCLVHLGVQLLRPPHSGLQPQLPRPRPCSEPRGGRQQAHRPRPPSAPRFRPLQPSGRPPLRRQTRSGPPLRRLG